MKIFLILAVILTFFLQLPLFAADKVEIISKNFIYESSDGKLSINIKYPEIKGLENDIMEKELNEFFKKEFLTGYGGLYGKDVNFLDDEDLKFCHEDLTNNFGPDSTYEIEVDYNIKANKNNILSIYYGGLAILTPSAHPAKLINTLTLNLDSGEVYEFKDLFREDSDYMSVIDNIVVKYEYYIAKNDDGSYNFYLTPEDLVFLNINAPYVIQGLEGTVEFQGLEGDIIDEKGPIGILMGK